MIAQSCLLDESAVRVIRFQNLSHLGDVIREPLGRSYRTNLNELLSKFVSMTIM